MDNKEKNNKGPDKSGLSAPEGAASSRVMRQLLKTPAFKELLLLSMKDIDADEPRELVKTIMWEDSALSFSTLGALPHDLNFLAAFMDELGLQLQQLPPEMFRQFVAEMEEKLDKDTLKNLPSAYLPLIESLIWEDAENRKRLRRGVAEALNALMKLGAESFVKADYAVLEDKDSVKEENDDGAYGGVDPVVAGQFITSLFRWLGSAAGKDENEVAVKAEEKSAFYLEALKSSDFGVIRRGIVKKSDAAYAASESVISYMVSDPIIFANLFSMLPPLLNNTLKGTSTAINNLDFPPEILASAIFNFLEELDGDAVCSIVNGLAGFVNGLHEGNLILGRDEPRFRPVLQRFLERSFTDLDEEEAAAALLALFEDSEVVLTVAADFMLQKPALVTEFFPACLEGANAQLRGLVYFSHKLNQFSPETYEQFASELEEIPAYNDAAALINSLVKLTNTVIAKNPSLLENVFAALYNSLEKEEIHDLARSFATGAYNFAVKENVFAATPAYAGRKLNELLTSYNKKLESEPEKIYGAMSSYFKEIDYNQLTEAIIGTMKLLTQAIQSNPEFSKALMKSVASFASGLIKTSITPIKWNMSLRSDKKRDKKERWGS